MSDPKTMIAATGAELWSTPTGSSIDSSPAVANGVIYVGSWDGNVYAFDAASGAKLWTGAIGDVVISSPAVANGMVYVGSWDGNLHAYALAGARTGETARSAPSPR
jgi:outer membrane protein assembly factor BamB